MNDKTVSVKFNPNFLKVPNFLELSNDTYNQHFSINSNYASKHSFCVDSTHDFLAMLSFLDNTKDAHKILKILDKHLEDFPTSKIKIYIRIFDDYDGNLLNLRVDVTILDMVLPKIQELETEFFKKLDAEKISHSVTDDVAVAFHSHDFEATKI
jgi:hypothetical protein